MDLYYSLVNIEPGANVIFMNNSASDRGGAVYIGPGIKSNS